MIEQITREEAARRLFSGEWDELTAGEIRERYPLIEPPDPDKVQRCLWCDRPVADCEREPCPTTAPRSAGPDSGEPHA